MYLSRVLLQNFRSYSQKLLDFDPKVNLIIGPNGSGKTNILESIYFLSSGKSFRASALSQLLAWEQSFATVRAKLIKNQNESELEVQLVKSENGTSSVSRNFLIEKVKKSRKIYLDAFQAVVFHPEDIRLVTGSPSRRREFLDEIFTSFQWRYASALTQYHKALKHRNELLDLIRLGKALKTELFYWDQSLVKNDAILHEFRQQFIRHLNSFFSSHPDSQIKTIYLNYCPSILSLEKLENNYSLDLARGHTQSGAHRDDFSFDNNIFPGDNKDLANWGSRGQQRLAVLALRLGQIDYLETTSKFRPVLLLDDIFSELDSEHQKLVTSICHRYQTIFTSSDPESIKFFTQTPKVITL